MYSKQWDERQTCWRIEDPDGDFICYVEDDDAADALLSHLNR